MTPEGVLTLRAGDALAELVPARGGIVTRFAVGGDEVLYLDPATLVDPARNVRGGVPVLFPLAGRLERDALAVQGRAHTLKQHGFARNLPWEVVSHGAADAHLRLRWSEATFAAFPFHFELRSHVRVTGARLCLTFQVENPDRQPLPLHFGLHPYFRVSMAHKAGARVETEATQAWDNRSKTRGPFRGVRFDGPEVDVHLLDHPGTGTRLTRGPDARALRLTWSPEFRTLVLWTLPDRDFVCVEPWTAPAGALQTGEGLLQVPGSSVRRLEFTVELE